MRLERCASARRSRTTRRVYTTYDESSTTSRTPTISSGAPRRIGSADPVGPYIRPQHFGNGHRAVRLLVVLEDAGDRAREREAGAVERVHEARLLALRGPVADVGAPRLEVGEGAARADTSSHAPTPGAHASRSYVFALREAGVARREQLARDRECRAAAASPRRVRAAARARAVGLLRRGSSAPARPCRTGACAACRACPCPPIPPRGGSTACTRRTPSGSSAPSRISSRYRFVTGTSAVGMRNRSSPAIAVRVVLELRQLAGAGHARAVHEHGRPDLLVAVLARVHVEEEVQQRADEPRAAAAEHGEAGAADLRAALEVEQPVLGGDLPVRPHAGGRARRRPSCAR